MSIEIAGLGTALPRGRVTQDLAAQFAMRRVGERTERTDKIVGELYRRSGVRSRHTVILNDSESLNPEEQTFYAASSDADDLGPTTAARMAAYRAAAADLAVESSRCALENGGTNPDQIRHLVTVSCTGFSAPGVDLEIIRKLELNPETTRTHVGFMGCHGAMNGLRVARGHLGVDPTAHVLVCATELCTLHHQYGWDPEKIVANSLFADGSAAAVLRTANNSSSDGWELTDGRSFIVPETEDSMSWGIEDHGFEMTLSPQVPSLIHTYLEPQLERWLADFDLSLDDVGCLAIHPGGPRILTAVAEAAGFDREMLATSQGVLADYGNMSSPTVLFILDRLRHAGAKGPCVMLGFGPGLTIEYALLRPSGE